MISVLTLNILYTSLMETKPTRIDNKNKKFGSFSRRYRSFLGLSQVLFRLEHNIMNLMEWKQKTKFYVQKDISRYVQGHHRRVWCDIKLIQESSWLPLVHDALHGSLSLWDIQRDGTFHAIVWAILNIQDI